MSGEKHSHSVPVRAFLPETSILSDWLKDLRRSDILTLDHYSAARKYFRIAPDIAAWRSFMQSTALLLGVLFFVAGVIMFFAWNWEAMPKWSKFMTAEIVFISFSVWAVLKWRHWSGYAAMMGAGLMVGAMMALYGQIYQTGADSWELFRAWSLVLLVLAIIARRMTGLWFMAWLTGNLWASLYIIDYLVGLDYSGDFPPFLCEYIFVNMLLWAGAEAAVHFFSKTDAPFDPTRWLTRLIGAAVLTAIFLLMLCVILDSGSWDYDLQGIFFSIPRSVFLLFAAGSLAAVFFVYSQKIIDMFFVSLVVMGIAIIADATILKHMFDNGNFDAGIFITAGLLIIATCFLVMTVILAVRKKTLEKLTKETKAGKRRISFHVDRAPLKAHLTEWVIQNSDSISEKLKDYFDAEEKAQENHQPWYMKIPMVLGIWLGSLLLIGGTIGLLFIDVNSVVLPVSLGFVLCVAGGALRRDPSFVKLQLSLVATLCGLVLIGFLIEDSFYFACVLYAAIFLSYWATTKDTIGKSIFFAAFLGALLVLAVYYQESWDYYRYVEEYNDSSFSIVRSFISIVGTLAYISLFVFSVWTIVLERDVPKLESRSYMFFTMAAGFILFALCVRIFVTSTFDMGTMFRGQRTVLLWMPLWGMIGGVVVSTAALAWKYKKQAVPIIIFGAMLTAISYASDAIALGLMLLILARHLNSMLLCGFSVLYLTFYINRFYYMMEVSFLDKSIILMVLGIVLTLFSFGVRHLLAPESVMQRGGE